MLRVTTIIDTDLREGLKSAHRRAKPRLIGKLFNENILSPQNGDFKEVTK